ncbi:MAG: fructose-bisphosphate aldolase class I [Rhodospirillaceae bacterium]|nr:fructose-bisphosphate aldolase class I [Rhodospirillaceae bacterium]
MDINKLASVAQAMVADDKGLLAADESTGTIGKRFDTINVVSSADTRRDYRELLFKAKDIEKFISGVILYDETIRQSASDGTSLVDLMLNKNIIPGIKVDAGAKPLAGSQNETVTEGLDGLAARVEEYVGLGAQFAKWRAVIKIGEDMPSGYAIHTNAHALARYAKICQEGGLVPIVEPEVLMDGDHDVEVCQHVTEETLNAVFGEIYAQGVELEAMILKPNMIIPGSDCVDTIDTLEIADRTVATLKRCGPAAVPGIMFLSGGQSEADATLNLNTMNAQNSNLPWKLSYSYGRALQASALQAWKGVKDNVVSAQKALTLRAKLNSEACKGNYLGE